MATTHRLLRALADRPDKLALLLRCEYQPGQTLLHHAAAEGDVALIDTLLTFDPSLARLDLVNSSGECWAERPPATPLVSAIVALQPAAIRVLLPHSWPPLCHGGAASKQPVSSSPSSPASSTDAESWSPAAFQACMLALLLHVAASCEGWPPARHYSDWNWPKPVQPPPPDWRQQVEATLAALLEGTHGLDINACDRSDRSALFTAVLYSPPWAAHLVLRHGAGQHLSADNSLLGSYIAAVSKRQPSEEHVRLLEVLLDAGASLHGAEVELLAQSACGCHSAEADPEAHLRQWRAMLHVLLRHGASLPSKPGNESLLQLALRTMTRGIRYASMYFTSFDEEFDECCAVGPPGAPLVEAFVEALVQSGFREAEDVASSASRLLRQMFDMKREELEVWERHDRPFQYRVRHTKFDGPSVQCCLRALRMACAPCSAQQAQQLLHEAIGRAAASADRIPAFHLEHGSTLTVQDRQRELQGWLAAIRFAVEIGADANGSWEGVHPLRNALVGAISAAHVGWMKEWQSDPWARLPVTAALEVVSLLVEVGACAGHDEPVDEQEPLLWLALKLRHPDLLHLLLAAGASIRETCHGQTALQYLLTPYKVVCDWTLSKFVEQCHKWHQAPSQADLGALQLAHLWAVLLESGCPPAAPPRQMAQPLARVWLQPTCGWVWVLAEGIPWHPSVHSLFPPAFRAAARALLLANHRGMSATKPPSSSTGIRRQPTGRIRQTARRRQPTLEKQQQLQEQQQQQQAVRLPSAVVQRVLRISAASLSAWLPPLPSCWLEAEL